MDMTTNREQTWRLEDAEGKPMGEKPREGRFVFSGRGINRNATDMDWGGFYGGEVRGPVRMGSFAQQYVGEWGTSERVETRTHEVEHADINDMMIREIDRYRRSSYAHPEYISLNRSAYLLLHAQRRGSSGEPRRGDNFMGIEVMCNPRQEEAVLVLGTGRQEAFERGLYREE